MEAPSYHNHSEQYPVVALVSSTVPTKPRLSETGSRLSGRTCKRSGCGQRWRKSAPKCRLRIVAQQNHIRISTTPCFIQYCNHCQPGRDQSHYLKKGLVSGSELAPENAPELTTPIQSDASAVEPDVDSHHHLFHFESLTAPVMPRLP
jgi:hypothetical protein